MKRTVFICVLPVAILVVCLPFAIEAQPVIQPLTFVLHGIEPPSQFFFWLEISLNQDITRPFDYYLLADTCDGVYTVYLNGDIEPGITPIRRNVPRYNAPFSITLHPSAINGCAWTTFYTAAIEAGKIPPVRRLSDLTPSTQYVIMMDKRMTKFQ